MKRAARRDAPLLERPRASVASTVAVYRCQLVHERTITVPVLKVTNPGVAADVVRLHLDAADREHFVVLLLDAAAMIVGLNTVAVGSPRMVHVTLADVLKPAILHNADRIVVAHNHTNGDVRPSKEDRALTRAIERAAKQLAIQLVDHVILGRGKAFYSFRDHDLLKD